MVGVGVGAFVGVAVGAFVGVGLGRAFVGVAAGRVGVEVGEGVARAQAVRASNAANPIPPIARKVGQRIASPPFGRIFQRMILGRRSPAVLKER
ncbi:hypothetical protein [Thermoflexus sp.]|uniref:hypothetical protein n=1 Tax=Thermoflexus sp. TaxID=1969742 RepID=UPI0025D00670|nr:hypothetical protein [Thermoflexus sp.]